MQVPIWNCSLWKNKVFRRQGKKGSKSWLIRLWTAVESVCNSRRIDMSVENFKEKIWINPKWTPKRSFEAHQYQYHLAQIKRRRQGFRLFRWIFQYEYNQYFPYTFKLATNSQRPNFRFLTRSGQDRPPKFADTSFLLFFDRKFSSAEKFRKSAEAEFLGSLKYKIIRR